VPGIARLDDGALTRLATSDFVLVDGTFWRDDALAQLGISILLEDSPERNEALRAGVEVAYDGLEIQL
jgi:hypothetical protein